MRKSGLLQLTTVILAALSVNGVALAADTGSVGEPGRESGKPNPLKNVYFGEQHMHTRNSFDAFTIGVSATWDDAYKFAKGEEIKLSTSGKPMKRRTPYDFVAITDHSEYYGVLKEFANPKSDLSKSDFAKQIVAGVKDPSKAGPAVQKLIQTLVKHEPLPEYVTPELRRGMWGKFIATADKHNEPGKFTALYAYEWTSIPNGANMHRNVFFKDKAASAPFSSFDSVLPQDLWTYLEIQRDQEGIDVFAIPHNSNVSDGWMFSESKFIGTPMDAKYASRNIGATMDARYARRQNENEPLFEIHQTKGNSEAHPWLSPNDEFANFEPFPSLISLDSPSQIKGSFYRQGLVEGMRLEGELGFNPYKMGVVAGADVHSGYQGNEEWDWNGAHGNQDDTPQKRLNPVKNATGETGYVVSSAGTTAARTIRARPVRFSDKMGLRLCGMAEEPFCPGAKYSSASRTSVRCRWRTSRARFSTEPAITPSVAKNWAWRSRGMTWVDTGSGRRPSLAATCASTAGSMLAKVPTAPEMAQVAISSRAQARRRLARLNAAWCPASFKPKVVGSA